ncbi:hypothetical protein JCM5296_002744 [Sporobolomyces johnsonii]
MAAAVMRAMTFGATSSREGRPSSSAGRDKDHSSRNSSRNRLSWGLSTREQDLERERDRAGEEPRSSLSLSRSRSSSRLNPPNPACTGRGPTGILLNANRPASDSPIPLLSPTSSPPNGNGVYHAPSSASSPTASNLDLARTVSFDAASPPTSTVTRPSPPMRSHSSSSILQHPSIASNHDQSRSSSTSCGEPSASSPTGGEPGEALVCSGTMTADSSTTGSVSAAAARKIRFAPLPQIRPRAYSTGRNLWFEGADFEGEAAEGEEGATRRLVRRENTDEHVLEDEYDDDHDEGAGGPLQKWGSWGEISAWVAGSKKDKDDDAISVASSTGVGAGAASGAETPTPSSKDAYSKILKPWRFGKSKKSKSSLPRKDSDEGTGLGGGAALSRQSSADSDVSRRSSVDVGVLTSTGPRPKVSTGVPMRKANTWDSSESPSSTSRPSSLRGSASPIARSSSSYGQPGQHSQSQPIYYASPARTGTRRANYPPVAQRSRLARPPQKQPAKVDEPAFHEWGSSRSVGSVGSATSKSGGEEDDGSGMAWIRRRRAQREREEKEKREREERGGDKDAAAPTTARDDSMTPVELVSRNGAPEALPTNADDHNDDEIRARERKFPARTSTLDSTVSSASTVMPTPPSPSLTGSSTPTRSLSALSMTRPNLSGDTAVSSAGSTATVGTATSTAKWEQEGEEGVVMIDEPEEEDDEDEDEDEDDEGEKPDDESDLDEDELAQEEALMQAARRTAKGAGHERYHSASHRNKLTVVEHVKQQQPTRRASTSSNSAGVNVKGA